MQLRSSYNMFADPMLIPLIVVVLLLSFTMKKLCRVFGRLMKLWRIPPIRLEELSSSDDEDEESETSENESDDDEEESELHEGHEKGEDDEEEVVGAGIGSLPEEEQEHGKSVIPPLNISEGHVETSSASSTYESDASDLDDDDDDDDDGDDDGDGDGSIVQLGNIDVTSDEFRHIFVEYNRPWLFDYLMRITRRMEEENDMSRSQLSAEDNGDELMLQALEAPHLAPNGTEDPAFMHIGFPTMIDDTVKWLDEANKRFEDNAPPSLDGVELSSGQLQRSRAPSFIDSQRRSSSAMHMRRRD
jgi:hypothetical protein